MSQIQLLGVEHEDSGNLIDRFMFPLIYERVLPILTNEHVIVLEGGKGHIGLKPKNPWYKGVYEQLGPIALSGITPILHSDDPMYRLSSAKELQRGVQVSLLKSYEDFMHSALTFHEIPDTWDALIAKIKSGSHNVTLNQTIPAEWRARIIREKEMTIARDTQFARQIKFYAKHGKQVLFVGGVFHCVALTAQFDWPVIFYECTPKAIGQFYFGWFIFHGLPGLLD